MRVWTSWDQLQLSKFKLQNRNNHQSISVIVIGRNEAESIEACIQSIASNNYPADKFEIIFVDDHSSDDTVKRVETLGYGSVSILHLSDYPGTEKTTAFKKAAMKYAISHANGEIIACTDADCEVPKNWLGYIDYRMQQSIITMLVMPISYFGKRSIINRFQSLDLMATMAFTAYGVISKQFYSANGANMAFRKSVYAGINMQDQYASGDDMFLVQNLSDRYPDGVKFLKSTEVIVRTKAESKWKDLYQQRKRWATKSKGYSNRNLYTFQMYLFLFNALILLNIILGLSINSLLLFTALFQTLIKGIMDFLLLSNISKYFKQQEALKLFIISFLLFTPYILIMGIFAIFGKSYNWKGRNVS